MIRKSRKINKMRGTRTCGGGCSKKRRGAGHRGGRGNAGSGKEKKQKYPWFQKYDPDHLGKYGFQRADFLRSDQSGINLSFIDENMDFLIESGIAEKETDGPVVDVSRMGVRKVLGTGRVTQPLTVKALSFSEKAKMKIENAGGKVVIIKV
ncbi:MAG: uL15m family ribosomal protein [Candidatus Methanofastidiosia archaeon]